MHQYDSTLNPYDHSTWLQFASLLTLCTTIAGLSLDFIAVFRPVRSAVSMDDGAASNLAAVLENARLAIGRRVELEDAKER